MHKGLVEPLVSLLVAECGLRDILSTVVTVARDLFSLWRMRLSSWHRKDGIRRHGGASSATVILGLSQVVQCTLAYAAFTGVQGGWETELEQAHRCLAAYIQAQSRVIQVVTRLRPLTDQERERKEQVRRCCVPLVAIHSLDRCAAGSRVRSPPAGPSHLKQQGLSGSLALQGCACGIGGGRQRGEYSDRRRPV